MQPKMDEEMDEIIFDALTDLGRLPTSGDDVDKVTSSNTSAIISSLVEDWLPFSREVAWISSELSTFVIPPLEETVGEIKSVETDLQGFRMELSSFLKELECPYEDVMGGASSTADRFASISTRKRVLFFLVSELQASKILFATTGGGGGGSSGSGGGSQGVKVSLDETANAGRLREICEGLGLGKPPETITADKFWAGLNAKAKVNVGEPIEPLFQGQLSPAHWTMLEDYFKELQTDYKMRREMLLKRLDVTVQSFHWKGVKQKEINNEFEPRRLAMKQNPNVLLSDVFAARRDLAVVEKTSSASVRKNTRSKVNDVKIGRVPDRGGRPDEVEPPPPEMPSWQQRQGGPPASSGWKASPNQRGGGGPRGGGGGGRGGGRVQGGWSDRGSDHGGRGGGGGYHQQGGYRQQQQDFQGGGGGGHYQQQQQSSNYQEQQQGGGYYQHDQRGGDDNYSNQQYHHRGGGGGHSRNYDDQGGYRGGGGGRRGRGQRY